MDGSPIRQKRRRPLDTEGIDLTFPEESTSASLTSFYKRSSSISPRKQPAELALEDDGLEKRQLDRFDPLLSEAQPLLHSLHRIGRSKDILSTEYE